MESVLQPALILLLSVLSLQSKRCQPRCVRGWRVERASLVQAGPSGSGSPGWLHAASPAAVSKRLPAAVSSLSDWAGGFNSLLSATIILADSIHLHRLQFWFLKGQHQGDSVTNSLLKAKYDFEQKIE